MLPDDGLTIATPRSLPMAGTTSTNNDASVIKGIGNTPACDCTKPFFTIPNVTVGVGAAELSAGVMTAYPDFTVPCSTPEIGNGAVVDGGNAEMG